MKLGKHSIGWALIGTGLSLVFAGVWAMHYVATMKELGRLDELQDSWLGLAILERGTLLQAQGSFSASARDLGIRVTRQEIQTFLRDNWRNADGSFDQELIVDVIEREYGTQRLFLDWLRKHL